jgi:hypothetical protein
MKTLLPFGKMLFYDEKKKSNFREHFNINTPGILTISPGSRRNSERKGYYGNSSATLKRKLYNKTVSMDIGEQ